MKTKGYYMKHFNTNGEKILTYDATCKTKDNYYIASKLLNTTTFQAVEERKDFLDNYDFTYDDNCNFDIKDINKYYNTILYSFYNIYGERVKNMLVHFDFENNTITVNGKTMKVDKDKKRKYTFKVLKTKINAIDGIKGLYRFIVSAMHVESVFNCRVWNLLELIGENK